MFELTVVYVIYALGTAKGPTQKKNTAPETNLFKGTTTRCSAETTTTTNISLPRCQENENLGGMGQES